MPNFNLVVLMGHMTRDPELRYTTSGTPVCSFGIAVNKHWTTKEGEKKEKVSFVECTSFGKQGEVIKEHFAKGKPIHILGELDYNQWEDKDGGKRSMLKVLVNRFEFIAGQTPSVGVAKKDEPDIAEEELPF